MPFSVWMSGRLLSATMTVSRVDFPKFEWNLRAAIGRPLFDFSREPSYYACHCEPVVLRAANQNLNDCQWQSYLNVTQTGVALSKDSLRSQSVLQAFPSGVVLRTANLNQSIASGNCTMMCRCHGVAVTDEGLASPFGRGAGGGEGDFYPLSRLRRQLPQRGSQGGRGKRIATSADGLLAMTSFFSVCPRKTLLDFSCYFSGFRL